MTIEHVAVIKELQDEITRLAEALRKAEHERDTARTDADEMAGRFEQAALTIHEGNYHSGEFSECTRRICDENRRALAARRAATGSSANAQKAVTP